MEPLTLFLLILLALALALGVLVRTRSGGVVARMLLRPLVRAVYSFHVEGGRNVPRHGGVLLVANHVSYADAFLLGACVDRPVRFLMHRSFLNLPLVGAFTRWVGAIPVASGDTPEERDRALGAASRALEEGHLVAVFGEGRITRTGALLGFRRGLETIAQQAGAPIVPVALDEVWGSIFSFAGGRAVLKWPRRLPYRVRVCFGVPLPSDAPAHRVRDAIGELLARSAERRALDEPDLARSFVRTARRHPNRPALVEAQGACLSYRELLTSALALASELCLRLPGEERVGVLLHPGRRAAEVHVAAALAGRAVVALDPGHGAAAAADLVARAGLRHVIVSARHVAQLGWNAGWEGAAKLLLAEDLSTTAERHRGRAALLARLPASWLLSLQGGLPRASDPAVVLATSGTGGVAQAVELAHAAIASNVRALALVGELGPDDVVLGVLPFSHAFGYTATLWAPLLTGASLLVGCAASDTESVARVARERRPSVLLGTPSLFAIWLRRLQMTDVASIRLAISGGEHLPASLAAAWREHLGVELYEGYGSTELGPVVSVNLPDVERGGLVQHNHEPGTVGRSLPGVAVRVVRTPWGELSDPDEPGHVLVRGPGRMTGYLENAAATAAACREGWYDTGDVGAMSREGFLSVVDRRERFVELEAGWLAYARIEDALRSSLPAGTAQLAVVTRPGAAGPRLAVVHTPLDRPLETLRRQALSAGLPASAVPPREDWVEVPSLPLQPSGKLDLRALESLACGAGSDGAR